MVEVVPRGRAGAENGLARQPTMSLPLSTVALRLPLFSSASLRPLFRERLASYVNMSTLIGCCSRRTAYAAAGIDLPHKTVG